MNKRLAQELVEIAKDLILAAEFTPEQWKKYQKQHPEADKKNHKIVRKKEEKGEYEDREGSLRGMKKWVSDINKYDLQKKQPKVFKKMMTQMRKDMKKYKISPKEIGL